MFNHSIPSHCTNLEGTIVTGSTIYKDLNKILNNNWPHIVPFSNLSAPSFDTLPAITPMIHIGSHLSFLNAAIMLAFTIIISYLIFKVTRHHHHRHFNSTTHYQPQYNVSFSEISTSSQGQQKDKSKESSYESASSVVWIV
jgi:hypothetical protein